MKANFETGNNGGRALTITRAQRISSRLTEIFGREGGHRIIRSLVIRYKATLFVKANVVPLAILP